MFGSSSTIRFAGAWSGPDVDGRHRAGHFDREPRTSAGGLSAHTRPPMASTGRGDGGPDPRTGRFAARAAPIEAVKDAREIGRIEAWSRSVTVAREASPAASGIDDNLAIGRGVSSGVLEQLREGDRRPPAHRPCTACAASASTRTAWPSMAWRTWAAPRRRRGRRDPPRATGRRRVDPGHVQCSRTGASGGAVLRRPHRPGPRSRGESSRNCRSPAEDGERRLEIVTERR